MFGRNVMNAHSSHAVDIIGKCSAVTMKCDDPVDKCQQLYHCTMGNQQIRSHNEQCSNRLPLSSPVSSKFEKDVQQVMKSVSQQVPFQSLPGDTGCSQVSLRSASNVTSQITLSLSSAISSSSNVLGVNQLISETAAKTTGSFEAQCNGVNVGSECNGVAGTGSKAAWKPLLPSAVTNVTNVDSVTSSTVNVVTSKVGQTYQLNISGGAKISSDTSTANIAKVTSVVQKPCAANNVESVKLANTGEVVRYQTGKQYEYQLPDGNKQSGVWDGRYLITTTPAKPVTAAAKSESPSQSMESIEKGSCSSSVSVTPCKVNLPRLTDEHIAQMTNLGKRRKLELPGSCPQITISSKSFYHSDSRGPVTSERVGRQRRNLTSNEEVIQIDLDDSDECDVAALPNSKCPTSCTGVSVSVIDSSSGDEELLYGTVSNVIFRASNWRSSDLSFFRRKIVFSDARRKTITLPASDMSSIKLLHANSPNHMPVIKINVKSSFICNSIEKWDSNSPDVLTLLVTDKQYDTEALKNAVDQLNKQVSSSSETSRQSSPILHMECQSTCDDINSSADGECYSTPLTRQPLHAKSRPSRQKSEALRALSEYCDDSDPEDTVYHEVLELDVPVFTGEVVKLFTYPAPPAVGGITVTNEDLFCLNNDHFLNDVIIEFYIKYIQEERLSPDQQARVHIFNTFFYGQLTKKHRDSSPGENGTRLRHERVKRWTKHVDLFSKDFIVIPINEDAHWFLAIICFPYLVGRKQLVAVENAEQSPHCTDGDKQLPEDKKKYLQSEWNLKKAPTEGPRSFDRPSMKGATPACPQQNNSSDCGIYLLHYIEKFFEKPLHDFNLPIRYLQTWFPDSEISTKRRAIRRLILKKQKELNPSLIYDPLSDGCQVD